MYLKATGILLAALLLTGCVGLESASSPGFAEQSAQDDSLEQLISGTGSTPKLGQACYTVPGGTRKLGPSAYHCIHIAGRFMCVPECW